MVRQLRSWWRAVRARSVFERDMDDELRFHLESRADDLVRAGVARADAVRRARLEFGNPEAWQDRCRESRRLHLADDARLDLRFALRSIRRDAVLSGTVDRHPGARHRRHDGHLQRRERRAAAPAALPRAGSPGTGGRSRPTERRHLHAVRSGFRGSARQLPPLRGYGGVFRNVSEEPGRRHRARARVDGPRQRELLLHASRAAPSRSHVPPKKPAAHCSATASTRRRSAQ